MMRRNVEAISAIGAALAKTGRPTITTSGTLVMSVGHCATEDDAPVLHGLAPFRIAGKHACLALVDRGVRASVRLTPTVHGARDHGLLFMLIQTARITGVSAYVGNGADCWHAVDRSDAAGLFLLALERSDAGSVLHGVAANVVLCDIARTIGRGLGLPVTSVTPEAATSHFISPFGDDLRRRHTRRQHPHISATRVHNGRNVAARRPGHGDYLQA